MLPSISQMSCVLLTLLTERGRKMNSDNIFIWRLGLQSITSLETKGTVANGNCLWKQNVITTSDFPQRGLHSLLRMQPEWMPALLSCTWPAAADVYCATVLQRSFSVTFHTLLSSIIVAVVRNLPYSELFMRRAMLICRQHCLHVGQAILIRCLHALLGICLFG